MSVENSAADHPRGTIMQSNLSNLQNCLDNQQNHIYNADNQYNLGLSGVY